MTSSYLFLSLLCGDVKGRVQILGLGVHLRPGLKQQNHNVNIAKSGGDMQRGLLLLFRRS